MPWSAMRWKGGGESLKKNWKWRPSCCYKERERRKRESGEGEGVCVCFFMTWMSFYWAEKCVDLSVQL